MKTKTRLFLISLAIFALFQSCNVLEKGTSYNTKNYFIVEASGKSSNLSFAKETAMFNAKKKLAKKVFHNNPRNEETQNVIHQTLTHLRIIEEKCFVLKNGNYECEITLATPKKFY